MSLAIGKNVFISAPSHYDWNGRRRILLLLLQTQFQYNNISGYQPIFKPGQSYLAVPTLSRPKKTHFSCSKFLSCRSSKLFNNINVPTTYLNLNFRVIISTYLASKIVVSAQPCSSVAFMCKKHIGPSFRFKYLVSTIMVCSHHSKTQKNYSGHRLHSSLYSNICYHTH